MLPRGRRPPPKFIKNIDGEEFTGRVNLDGGKKSKEFLIEVIQYGTYKRKLTSLASTKVVKQVPYSKTIWRKASGEEIDVLILEDRMVCVEDIIKEK